MLNTVSIQGRLVADPELRTTQSGVSVCNFRVAVDRDYVPRDGERQADFFTVVCWRGTAEFVTKYFKKGQMIIINGTLQSRSYDDSNGIHRYSVEIQADRVNFAGSKQESASEPYNDTESRPAYHGKANYSRGTPNSGSPNGNRRSSGPNRRGGWGQNQNRSWNPNAGRNQPNRQNGSNPADPYDPVEEDEELPF